MAPSIRFRLRLLIVLAIAVVLPPAVAMLFYYPPTQHDFYPKCVFFLVTGCHCPGCGATRCLHALVHGDLVQALAFNLFLVISLPFLAWAFLRQVRQWYNPAYAPRRLPAWSIQMLFWLVLAFWILRNVAVYPCTLLAPHVLE